MTWEHPALPGTKKLKMTPSTGWVLVIIWLQHGYTVNEDGYWAALKTLREMVWFSSMTMPGLTRHSRLGICCRIRFGDASVSFVQSVFGTKEFSPFDVLDGALARPSFHQRWRRQTCYHRVAELTGISFLPARDGQTYYTLWQIPHTSRGLWWRIAYQWHYHSVLSFSDIRI